MSGGTVPVIGEYMLHMLLIYLLFIYSCALWSSAVGRCCCGIFITGYFGINMGALHSFFISCAAYVMYCICYYILCFFW